MGKVLVLCAGENENWGVDTPRQVVQVLGGEKLLARTIRQVRKRMNNYPHIITIHKCLRSYSTNCVVPSSHRWQCDTLESIFPIWGSDWTMVLLGDVLYSDELMDLIYAQREKFHYHFYGTSQDIFALSFTNNEQMIRAVNDTNINKITGKAGCDGKLKDLYYTLSSPIPNPGDGYHGDEDDLHYTYVLDYSRDFDSLEEYAEWRKTI